MAKYLDNTGLAYFWGKIKQYVENANLDLRGDINNKLATTTVNGHRLYSDDDNYQIVITKEDIGLGNVENVAAIPMSQKGANNGVAMLDASGKIPTYQLPGYVDDVLEMDSLHVENHSTAEHGTVYDTTTKSIWRYGIPPHNGPVTPAAGWYEMEDYSISGVGPAADKLYVLKSDNTVWRWSGSDFVQVAGSITLGTTSSTAFPGDKGLIAYEHATAKGTAYALGLYKITTNSLGHVISALKVLKSDITALGIPSTNTTYNVATTTTNGLMSSTDKAKLDKLPNDSIVAITNSEIDAIAI